MSATYAKQGPNHLQGLMPSCKHSIASNSQSVDHVIKRFIAANTTGCVFLTWHITHILQRNVGDSVRAWCMEIVHARFGGEGLALLSNQDLASYPTCAFVPRTSLLQGS